MLPFSLFVCFLGWKFAAHSWSLAEISPDPGGLPWRWAVKSLVVSGYALLAVTAVSIIVRTGAQLAGRAPASPEPEARDGT
jgi:TRAP-type mannitol/chloroaromatic compound transport system permease small subunit